MKILLFLLFSTAIGAAQTSAADQAAKAYKAAKDKLTQKHEFEKAKKGGDKDKVQKAYVQEVQKLDTRYVPILFNEIGLAQKAGDNGKEDALKQTLETVFDTKVGTVLMGGKVLDVSSAGKTKIGSLAEGTKIRVQYICGTWNVYPTSPMVSPDDTDTPQCNVKLVHSAVSGEETVIAPNIKHTREKPFEHTVEIRGSYFLEVSGTVGNAHYGSTVYRVVTEKN